MYVGSQYATCCMSPFWSPDFWGGSCMLVKFVHTCVSVMECLGCRLDSTDDAVEMEELWKRFLNCWWHRRCVNSGSVTAVLLRASQLVCVRWSTRTDLPPPYPAPGGKPDHSLHWAESPVAPTSCLHCNVLLWPSQILKARGTTGELRRGLVRKSDVS
jgi:hypothetical protein